MKKLSAACIILGISLFVGGCSNDHADDHIISLQDKISDAADSVSAQQETRNSSQDDRVYMDELSGSLQNFDGSHLTISSNGETYTFDVSQTRLECKYGIVLSDNVSIIYEGQLSGTDISTISPIKVTDQYHNETPLEDRTLKGKIKRLTANALVMVTEKGNTVTFPVTGVKQYYKKGIKAGRWVYVHFRGKFIGSSQIDTKQYDGSFTKVISVSDVDPMKVPEPTPTPSPEPKKKSSISGQNCKCQHQYHNCCSPDRKYRTECSCFFCSRIFQRWNCSRSLCKHYLHREFQWRIHQRNENPRRYRRRSGYTFCPQYLFHCNRNYSWNNGQHCPDPDLRGSKNPLRPRKRPGLSTSGNGRRCGPPGLLLSPAKSQPPPIFILY